MMKCILVDPFVLYADCKYRDKTLISLLKKCSPRTFDRNSKEGSPIIFVTATHRRCAPAFVSALVEKHGIVMSWCELYMCDGEIGPKAFEVKKNIWINKIEGRFRLDFVIESDLQAFYQWRNAGYKVLLI